MLHMKLAAYLQKNGISDEDFGQLIGVTRQAVHRYKTFERFPERSVLAEISKVTKGEVTANDFVLDQAIEQGAA
jgi:transcriptional regulator with XRE-family HTH domain